MKVTLSVAGNAKIKTHPVSISGKHEDLSLHPVAVFSWHLI